MTVNSIAKQSTEILYELGLFEKITDVPKLNQKHLEEFIERKRAFDWVHMGNADLTISKLMEVIRTTPFLKVPRSGHLGNWQDIAYGRAGALDYNNAICVKSRLGYPLVYNFNQTEDSTIQDGDWIYLPGSIVEKGNRTKLRLFTWNGSQFTERSREHSLCTPFVLTPVGGELVPLTRVHMERMERLKEFRFSYEASVILRHEPLVREILHALIEEARTKPNPQRALEVILDRAVALDGRVYRNLIRPDGSGWRVDKTYYDSTVSLIEATMLPFQVASEPETFFLEISHLPALLPIVSNLVINLLYALLNTHYPDCEIDRLKMTQPCNPHLHWGAIGMAGYPPKRRGYFKEKAGVAKELCQTVISKFPQLDPVFYILLPASVFTLWPCDAYPADLEQVEYLINDVHRETDPLVGKPNLMLKEIGRVVEEWYLKSRDNLSEYFLNRFSNRRSVFNEISLPEYGEIIKPTGFDTLTMRQASMMVGSLLEVAESKVE